MNTGENRYRMFHKCESQHGWKSIMLGLFSMVFVAGVGAQSHFTIEELTAQKGDAVSKEFYRLAKVIQDEINLRNSVDYDPNAENWRKDSVLVAEVEKLEAEEKYAAKMGFWTIAAKLKFESDLKKGYSQNNIIQGVSGLPEMAKMVAGIVLNNQRETYLQKVKKEGYGSGVSNAAPASGVTSGNSATSGVMANKVRNAEDNSTAELRYRRSSLYTLMIHDPMRTYENIIVDAFGNSPLPEKFNDHNIGPYLITEQSGISDQSWAITGYLNSNEVAKELVAKWFARDKNGAFNTDLIAARGEYDASYFDRMIANASHRGEAILADAGEDLIGNTFVIVNDYKYTNKEEVAQKVNKGLSVLGTAASFVPGAGSVTTVTNAAQVVTTIAGKGYIIKTTSYLYRLVWNDSVSSVFYNNFWIDPSKPDAARAAAFKSTDLFKLRLVGSESAWADVQSSIFTTKTEEELIRMATVRATDAAIAKLQRKFEEFRTKTPLLSVDPLTAKIGLKEGLEPGDKYEVLEKYADETGKISYKRKGVITVKKGMIWDNTYVPAGETAPVQSIDATHFNGSGGAYYPGMLIRQIN